MNDNDKALWMTGWFLASFAIAVSLAQFLIPISPYAAVIIGASAGSLGATIWIDYALLSAEHAKKRKR